MKDIDRYDEEAKKLGTDDNTAKRPRKKVEMSKYRPVPLYRSYGRTRREFKLLEELALFSEKAPAFISKNSHKRGTCHV